MTDRPIIFSAPMVRAILDGRKTQTRRVLKPKKGVTIFDCTEDAGPALGGMAQRMDLPLDLFRQPAAVGDRLWVRESWRASYGHNDYRDDLGRCPRPSDIPVGSIVEYLADETRELGGVNRPSIFMPRWASRLTLAVTEVRIERLQDISEADAVAEGIAPFGTAGAYLCPPGRDGLNQVGISAYDLFRSLWNSIHGADAWDANPWVAAITFEVHRANIDARPTPPVAPNLAQGG